MEDQAQEPSSAQVHAQVEDTYPVKRNEATDKGQELDRTGRIRIRNRRMAFLSRHPSYYESHDLELADPLLYDRCIKRFQNPTEREAESRSKGYAGVLEADLYRSEAKLKILRDQSNILNQSSSLSENTMYLQSPDGELLLEDPEDTPQSKEEGIKRWKDEMTLRFLNGKDKDFQYVEVDENDAWDIMENTEAEDRWFDDEIPEWISSGNFRNGETGIQDF